MKIVQVQGANSGIFFGDVLPLVEFGPQSHLKKTTSKTLEVQGY